MTAKSTIERLLDRVPIIKDACDVDLLLFFGRHPRVLITSEDLAQFVGYDRQRIARSLDSLIAGDVVRRSQNDAHAARMYVLDTTGPAGGWLPSVLSVAATREGRAAINAILVARGTSSRNDPRAAGRRVESRPLRVAHA